MKDTSASSKPCPIAAVGSNFAWATFRSPCPPPLGSSTWCCCTTGRRADCRSHRLTSVPACCGPWDRSARRQSTTPSTILNASRGIIWKAIRRWPIGQGSGSSTWLRAPWWSSPTPESESWPTVELPLTEQLVVAAGDGQWSARQPHNPQHSLHGDAVLRLPPGGMACVQAAHYESRRADGSLEQGSRIPLSSAVQIELRPIAWSTIAGSRVSATVGC